MEKSQNRSWNELYFIWRLWRVECLLYVKRNEWRSDGKKKLQIYIFYKSDNEFIFFFSSFFFRYYIKHLKKTKKYIKFSSTKAKFNDKFSKDFSFNLSRIFLRFMETLFIFQWKKHTLNFYFAPQKITFFFIAIEKFSFSLQNFACEIKNFYLKSLMSFTCENPIFFSFLLFLLIRISQLFCVNVEYKLREE